MESYNVLKWSHENSFETMKSAIHTCEFLERNLLLLVDEYVKQCCKNRNLYYVGREKELERTSLDFVKYNINNKIINIELHRTEHSTKKAIRRTLNKLSKEINPMFAISGKMLNIARKNKIVKIDIGSIGYINSSDYFSIIGSFSSQW